MGIYLSGMFEASLLSVDGDRRRLGWFRVCIFGRRGRGRSIVVVFWEGVLVVLGGGEGQILWCLARGVHGLM